ncbi:MAG TPA: secretin N-terminal domain-containing protein, partial [Gemmataceae bacterium]|nr:secretin N-terminal domain-containing protein [Gemmataceae bacterium]
MLPIRRCLACGILLALAAVLTFSTVHAQTPGDPKGMDPRALDPKGMDPKPGETKGMVQDPKDKKPAEKAKEAEKQKETPKVEDPADKKYSMQFAQQPWAQVMDWLKDITGLPIITTQFPTGTLKFAPPVDPVTKKPKEYTIPEIIDVLNEALLQQKYLIIRREASIMVWPADEPLPLELVKHVQVDDVYSKLAKTEFVRINYQLRSMQSDIFAPSVKKMMGPFGQVIPLEEANQLILIESVGNLREIVRTINKIEKDNEDQAGSYTYVCKYCRAAIAAEKLKDILGDPDKSGSAGTNPKGGGAGGGQAAAIQAGIQPQPAAKGNRAIKPHTIGYDDATNLVFVTGPPDKVNLAKQVLAKLDVPMPPGADVRPQGPPTLKTYLVPAGNAESTAKMLQDIYKSSSSMRINAVGTTQIMVYAPVADQMEIAAHIARAIPQSDVTFVYPLADSEANKIADFVLDRISGVPGAPMVKSDMSRNTIIIIGSHEQVEMVKQMIAGLTGEGIPGTKGPNDKATGNTRTIVLDKGGAATLATAIQNAWKKIDPKTPLEINNIFELSTGKDEKAKGGDKLNLKDVKKAVNWDTLSPEDKKFIEDFYNKSSKEEKKSDPKEPGKEAKAIERISDRYVLVSEPVEPQTPQPPTGDKGKTTPAQKKDGITITTMGNKLVVTSDNPEALAKMSELIRMLTTNPMSPADFEIIALKTASAAQAASILDQVFNGPTGGGGGGGKGGAAPGGKGGKGGAAGGQDPLAAFLGQIGGNPGAVAGVTGVGGTGGKRVERIRVVADSATNKLLVWASPLDFLIIQD